MTTKEFALLNEHLKYAKSYLEWGAGQSTLSALRRPNIETIVTIESSLPFWERFSDEYNVPEDPRFHLQSVFIGQTRDWGYPINTKHSHLWPNYALAPFQKKHNYDLVLIDGRFRVACGLACFLSLSSACQILVHDFWDRPHYHILTKFFTVKQRVDNFAVLIVPPSKSALKIHAAKFLLRIYQYREGSSLRPIDLYFRVRKRLKSLI